MSLEDKIINPMAPAELPGQRSEPLPKSGKKRRKSGGNAGAASGKPKNDLDDEVGGDSTAVLTLGASDETRRPQKKMLFESASDGATLAFAPTIRAKTAPVPPATKPAAPVAAAPKAEPLAPAAKAPQPTPARPASEPGAAKVEPAAPVVAVAPKAEPAAPVAKAPTPAKPASEPMAAATTVEPVAPVAKVSPAPAKPASEPVAAPPVAKAAEPTPAPSAAAKSPVFQVSALVMREPAPQPEPKDEAQAELALALDPVVEKAAAPDVAAPAAVAKGDDFHESLTLAFDATLADGLAERSAAAEKEIASEPAAPAPTPSFAPEPVASRAPEPAPAAIETPVRAEPQPAPAAIEPPAPAYVAPVAAAPKVEPKPESETPNRALSRSEMIARAARQSARPAARPTPTAAETLAAARTAQQQLRSADLPKNPGDIYGYWTRVKNGRRFPSRADFDAEQVAEHWPNSMLLTCGTAMGAGSHGSFSSVLRMGANRRTRPGDDLNFTSMITEWILATGGEAARAGAPVQDTEVFPTPDGTHAYKIVALPLSENQTRVDHVLCHLSRS